MSKKLILKNLTDYNTKNVSSDKTVDKKRFHEDGLYSEKIFGPLKDYVCACGTYSPFGGECKICGVKYTKTDIRGKQFGHIELPCDIINPLFMWNLNTRSRCDTKIDVQALIYYRKYLIVKDGVIKMEPIEDFDTVSKIYEHYTGAEAVVKAMKWLSDKLKEDPKFKFQEFIRPNIYKILSEYQSDLIINRILVVPPDLRPILFTGNKMMVQEKLSRLYTTLLTKINIMNNKTKFIKGVGNQTFKNYSDVQFMCCEIYEEILGVFGGKTGLLRGNMLGKRIDYSGRAVIAVDPSLSYNECRIPYYILLEVYKYSLARDIARKKNKMIFDILEEVEESLKVRDYRFLNEVEEYVKNKIVLLNRQPTLHKLGLLGWKILVSTDFTIKIHPCSCESYNADFDGDCVDAKVELVFDIATNNKSVFDMKDLLKVEMNDTTGKWEVC